MPVPIPTISITEEAFDTLSVPTQDDEADSRTSNSKDKGKAVTVRECQYSNEPQETADGLRAHAPHDQSGDWTTHEPPAALNDTTGVESPLVIRIIAESIDRVKQRITDEENERRAKAEAELEERTTTPNTAAEARVDEGQPILQPRTVLHKRREQPCAHAHAHATAENSSRTVDPHGWLTLPQPQPAKPRGRRSVRGLFRWLSLGGGGERGESSAAGASRSGLLAASSPGDFDLALPPAAAAPGDCRYSAEEEEVPIESPTAKSNDSSSPPSVQEEAVVECASCLDDVPARLVAVRCPCTHSYCAPCLARLVAAACASEPLWPPRCCLTAIPEGDILAGLGLLLLDPDNAFDPSQSQSLRAEYLARNVEFGTPAGERVYCAGAGCGKFVPPPHGPDGLALCPSCGRATCVVCRGEGPHPRGECRCDGDLDLARTEALAEAEGWRRCPGCRAYVEHRDACRHMTCRCRTQFCYVCGSRWGTCRCTNAQLTELKKKVEARRSQQRSRDAREEAEVREAIRLVAEFEREEARKAELQQLERLRRAEEHRRRALDRHIRRECERRREIQARFRGLQAALARIHERQQASLRRTHDAGEADHACGRRTAMDILHREHDRVRAGLAARAGAEVRQRETQLEREGAARAAEERRIEDEYRVQLEDYWAGEECGERSIEAALHNLRRRLDQSFLEWQAGTAAEMDRCRYEALEEQAKYEESMRDGERHLWECIREQQAQFANTKEAELKWFQAVKEERGKMLNDLEVDEVEHGEDIDAWFAADAFEDDILSWYEDDVTPDDIELAQGDIEDSAQDNVKATFKSGVFPRKNGSLLSKRILWYFCQSL
ncbi:hypothetical protein GGR56DRAFT_686201 [Xylariaceae sp. FL0804]|nr:hypothetical protein GGR56DRAFT_686201 [Xylariaceae sp. FL0804]